MENGSNVTWLIKGQTNDKICQYKLSCSSLFMANYFFGCSSTANVLTASNKVVKRAETRAGQGC